MSWILIGSLAGSLLTSTFDNREACEGRAVILREAKATVKCVEMPINYISSSSITVSPTYCGTIACGR